MAFRFPSSPSVHVTSSILRHPFFAFRFHVCLVVVDLSFESMTNEVLTFFLSIRPSLPCGFNSTH